MDKRQKILIVDDAEFNRVILKEILGETYNYLEAENGNQAIQIVEENPEIDLMLLDINMPQMNGFGVLEWMNRFQWIDETPVIMISSEESVDTMRKAYEMGLEICSSIPASFAFILSSVNAFAVIAMTGIVFASSLSIERIIFAAS